jgi:hypothetical protein
MPDLVGSGGTYAAHRRGRIRRLTNIILTLLTVKYVLRTYFTVSMMGSARRANSASLDILFMSDYAASSGRSVITHDQENFHRSRLRYRQSH